MAHLETTEQALRNRGVSRRDFMKFCALTAVAMGLGPGADLAIAQALSTKPRVPVLWINGLSCSCCTESFLRTAHPLATDIVLSMITMDYQDTIMAAAGDQANAAYEEAIKKYRGQYILAVEGNVPLNGQGMSEQHLLPQLPMGKSIYVYQLPIRIWHWVMVACVIVLIVTGYIIGKPWLSVTGEPYETFYMSPRPSRCSAPTWSRMVRESCLDVT